MQASELITKGDLNEFKSELLTEIKRLVQLDGQGQSKKWLKSNEVRKLLKISPGTLQNLRINGTLSYIPVSAASCITSSMTLTSYWKGGCNEHL